MLQNNLHVTMNNCKNASRIFKQTKSLIDAGLFDKVYIVGLKDDHVAKREKLDLKREIWRVSLRSRNWGNCFFIQLFKYLEWTVKIFWTYKNKNITVVTVHSLGILPLGVLLKLLYSARLVYDAHELETETNGLFGFRKWISKVTERVLFRFVNVTFVVSKSISEYYEKLYDVPQPLLVMNCPVYRHVKKSNRFREIFDIPSQTNIYIYQGLLSRGRGLELMLKTFENFGIKDRVIVFMGYGELESEIIKYSEKYESIYFHPAVVPNEILDYTSSADFGMAHMVFKDETCLSYYYSLPNKFFEYSMAGLPTVCPDIPEFNNIVNKYSNGVVVLENTTSSLTSALLSIESMNYNTMSNSLKNIVKVYNWEAQEINLLKGYDDLSCL